MRGKLFFLKVDLKYKISKIRQKRLIIVKRMVYLHTCYIFSRSLFCSRSCHSGILGAKYIDVKVWDMGY